MTKDEAEKLAKEICLAENHFPKVRPGVVCNCNNITTALLKATKLSDANMENFRTAGIECEVKLEKARKDTARECAGIAESEKPVPINNQGNFTSRPRAPKEIATAIKERFGV